MIGLDDRVSSPHEEEEALLRRNVEISVITVHGAKCLYAEAFLYKFKGRRSMLFDA